MKFFTFFIAIVLASYAYGQESLFHSINTKGIGQFRADGQVLFINQTLKPSGEDEQNNNATSLALTLDYNSPSIKNFSLGISYVQAINFQEYSSTDAEAADITQNGSFGIFNNAYVKYNLKALNFEEGSLVVGRFPLDLEFMNLNKIRQKSHAYEGGYFDIANLNHWDLKIGYLTRFSSWRSSEYEFRDIVNVYGNENRDGGQLFSQISYSVPDQSKVSLYYLRSDSALNTIGLSYDQKVLEKGLYTLGVFGKGIAQWDADNNHLNNSNITGLIQTGIKVGYDKFRVETGVFMIPQNKAGDNARIIAPFGPNLVPTNLLVGTDVDYKQGNTSFYMENNWQVSKKLSLYLLYLHTQDVFEAQETYFNEVDMIASYAITNRLSFTTKIGYVNENSLIEDQFLDIRFFLKYNL